MVCFHQAVQCDKVPLTLGYGRAAFKPQGGSYASIVTS